VTHVTVDSKACLEALSQMIPEGRAFGEALIVEQGERIKVAARQRARVRSGALRDHIDVTPLAREGAQSFVDIGAHSKDVPEAVTEEFGRHGEAPHPYMRPSVAEELR